MTKQTPLRVRRRGSVVVETGVILPLFLMLLLGIFEYGRFVMVRNLADNAAREGARDAVVHTYDQTTAQVQAMVLGRLAGQDNQLSSLGIQVFKADPLTGANLDAWTNARFGDSIVVQITGNYRPAVPSLLMMGSTIPMKAQAMMRCEAN
jgi:Flp pilus assembly protein TadG